MQGAQKILSAVLAFAAVWLTAPSWGFADTIVVAPAGEYAPIDTRLARATIEILQKGTAKEKQKAIEEVQAHPENYAPPVFYLLSAVLLDSGKKDEAAFWFYAGQLRARFDANRCADESAAGAVGILNDEFGPAINSYTFRDIPKLEALIPKVVEWDRKTPHNYDRRWINLHGMGATISGLSGGQKGEQPLSLPEEKWDEIAENTRTNYLEDFKEAMVRLKTGVDRMGEYRIRGAEVFFRNKKVKDADAASFQYLGGGYGKDKARVFYLWDLVEGADLASFASLGDGVAKDAKAVYYREKRCEECDVASFRHVGGDWYSDKHAAYEGYAFHRVPGIDQPSFTALNNNFAKDRHTVFYLERRIRGADPESFKLHACGEPDPYGFSKLYAEDKNRCYWGENAVPCDCAPHSMAEFPWGWTDLKPGMSLLAISPIHNIGPVTVSSGEGIYEKGYFVLPPGKQTIGLHCRDGKSGSDKPVQYVIDAAPGEIYSVELSQDGNCSTSVKRPVLVRGNPDGPEIRIVLPGDSKPVWQAELAPGKQTLTAICREVTRERAIEVPVSLTLDLEPGRIYRLSADFAPEQGKCEVKAAPLTR